MHRADITGYGLCGDLLGIEHASQVQIAYYLREAYSGDLGYNLTLADLLGVKRKDDILFIYSCKGDKSFGIDYAFFPQDFFICSVCMDDNCLKSMDSSSHLAISRSMILTEMFMLISCVAR